MHFISAWLRAKCSFLLYIAVLSFVFDFHIHFRLAMGKYPLSVSIRFQECTLCCIYDIMYVIYTDKGASDARASRAQRNQWTRLLPIIRFCSTYVVTAAPQYVNPKWRQKNHLGIILIRFAVSWLMALAVGRELLNPHSIFFNFFEVSAKNRH